MSDVRDAFRALRATPALTFVAVLSLALGIGANTAIFSLVNSLLLRALPVREPARLALLAHGSWSNPLWEEVRDRHAEPYAGVAAWASQSFDLADGGEADKVEGLWVSGRFFDVAGVQPILGRAFTANDDRRGAPDGAVAVISYRLWQQRFNGEAAAIGRTLTINRLPYTIIGVTPREFFGPTVGRTFDVAIPIGTEPLMRGAESWLDGGSTWWLEILFRLKPDQTLAQATAALRAAQPQIRDATMPKDWRKGDERDYVANPWNLTPAATGDSDVRRRYEQPLLTIMAVVVLVLVIACANIANLLLARANGRRHELSVRMALGASRWRLARLLLAESLLLSIAGAAAGLLFAQWGSRLLVRQLSTWRGGVVLDLSIDWRILAFTATMAIGTALLFGIAPAWRAASATPNDALKQQGRGFMGDGRRALAGSLVVAQVALSLTLVVGAGLFVRTFAMLANRDLGFDREGILIVTVDAQRSGVPVAQRGPLYARITAAVAQVPGVSRAAASLITPIEGSGWNPRIEALPGLPFRERELTVWMNATTPGWFATYGTALRAGRDFDAHDDAKAPPVAIVNEAFVRKFLPGSWSPIGQFVRRQGRPGHERPAMAIVGVAEDAAYRSPREQVEPTVYVPMVQLMAREPEGWTAVSLAVRAAHGSPMPLSKSVASALAAIDPGLSISFRSLSDQVDSALVTERIVAMLSGFFGGLALLLAAIGLYGVTSYAVSRRRAEIGLRMALGADVGSVIRLVLGRVAVLVSLGIAIGAALSLWAGRFIGALLYDLQPRDPRTLIGAAIVLMTIGALSGWLPARRAARTDPSRVLRQG